MLFTGLGRSVLGKTVPSVSSMALDLRPRAVLEFYPIRTSRPVNSMYLLTEWEGRTKNIWLVVRAYGPSAARSVPPDREPNIFPPCPTLLSQWAFCHMTTYCWKFLKFCFNLNRTWLHKIRRLSGRNNYIKVSTTKICHLFHRVEQETHNSSKTTTHFLIFVHAKKPTESWHKAVKNMSKPSKT